MAIKRSPNYHRPDITSPNFFSKHIVPRAYAKSKVFDQDFFRKYITPAIVQGVDRQYATWRRIEDKAHLPVPGQHYQSITFDDVCGESQPQKAMAERSIKEPRKSMLDDLSDLTMREIEYYLAQGYVVTIL